MPKFKYSQMDKKAEKAMQSAVRKVAEDHKRTGIPLAIWRNGKVAKVSVRRLKLT